MEQKSKLEMNSGGRNNPCGTEKQDRDENRVAEIIPVEQKSKIEMNPGGGNNPCGAKERARDESGRWK